MKLWSSRLSFAVGLAIVILLVGIPWARPAAAQAPAMPPQGRTQEWPSRTSPPVL